MASIRLVRGMTLGVFLVVSGGAQAAVKVCRAPQSSGIISAPTETEGKRKAIEAWTLKVKVSLDVRFAGWPVAANRIVRCSPPKDARVQCIAIATPCVIQQVPPKPNEKRKPGGLGKPIEA